MKNSIRLIQLSDCHVSADARTPYRGISPRLNLEQLLPRVEAFGPDAILLTGDLAEDGSGEAYAYLAEVLGRIGAPLLTLPGNHDHADRQHQHFPATAVDAPLVHGFDHWRVILLNTAVEGRIEGALSAAVLDQLDGALTASDKPVLLALHHQPVLTGSPWIDRYPLTEPQQLWQTLAPFGQVRAVVWGHVHHVFEAQKGAIRLLSAPSTAANSQAACARFTMDEKGPACRWFQLHENGDFQTGVMGVAPGWLA